MELPLFPDFFIVGAPRCGTTALASYLRRHPKVCFSNPKEPHYFNRVAQDVVLGFLGLEDDGRQTFPRRHQSQGFRYRWLQRLLFNPQGGAANLVMAYETARAKERGGQKKSWLRRLRKRLVAWNAVPRSPAPLTPEFRAEMEEVFREDVARLGVLIGRDLGQWVAQPR